MTDGEEARTDTRTTTGDTGADAVVVHLRRAGELIGARRLPEAELEILRALEAAPRDLRALKLLALVRFKLGRLAEAREVYRTALEAAPDDATVHFNLGLVALKLEWFEDAVTELETTTRLAPHDLRAWSYLGYALARTGQTPRAALAFRRAGQPEIAAELDRNAGSRGAAPAAVAPPRQEAPGPVAVPITTFAFSRLLPSAPGEAAAGGALRFPVQGEAHAREGALLATKGGLRAQPARRRKRGRLTDEPLGSTTGRFASCQGTGELWLSPAVADRGLMTLALEQDVVYLREDRVVAFDGEVVWESGNVPWDPMPLLQFRGTGRVVIEAADDEIVALRLPEGEAVTVPRQRLVGWLGRVVAQTVAGDDPEGGLLPRIACEGEGVLLLCRHGDAAQSVHERAQPGDDGALSADPGRPVLHR